MQIDDAFILLLSQILLICNVFNQFLFENNKNLIVCKQNKEFESFCLKKLAQILKKVCTNQISCDIILKKTNKWYGEHIGKNSNY